MKTKKAKNQKAVESTNLKAKVRVPKEVKKYQQARGKVNSALDTAIELSKTPAVKAYLKTQEAAKLPTAEEQRKKELDDLYDSFFMHWGYLSDYSFIFGEIAHADTNLSMDNLKGILNDMDERLWSIRKEAARVFEINGIVKEKTEDEVKEAAAKAA